MPDDDERGEDFDPRVQGEPGERDRAGENCRDDHETDLNDVPAEGGVLKAQTPAEQWRFGSS
jgi:hypothetical protein